MHVAPTRRARRARPTSGGRGDVVERDRAPTRRPRSAGRRRRRRRPGRRATPSGAGPVRRIATSSTVVASTNGTDGRRPPAARPRLARQRRAEHDEVLGVAAGEPARLARRRGAATPAPALHPVRRPLRHAGQEVERAADADQDRGTRGGAVAGDPPLLLRVAERDADDVRSPRPLIGVEGRRVHRPVGGDRPAPRARRP